MILGVVGNAWGKIEGKIGQAAARDMSNAGLAAMKNDRPPLLARSLFERTEVSTSTGAPTDVNAADENWSDTDYRVDDDAEVAAGGHRDGLLPGLLPATPATSTGLPLLDAIAAAALTAMPSEADDVSSASRDGLEVTHVDFNDSSATSLAQLDATDLDADLDFASPPLDELEMAGPDVHADLRVDEAAALDLENVSDELLETDWKAADNDRLDRQLAEPDSEWRADIDLPEYDAEARVEPWAVPVESDSTALRKARFKAAALSSALDLSTPAEVRRATDFLVSLYSRWRHPQTHRALLRLAEEGLDLDTMMAMVELRSEWERRSDWWQYRYRGEAFQHEGCRSALTWRLTYDVCLARSDFPLEGMIDEEWLNEWYGLRFGTPGYYNFAQYVAEKVWSEEAGVLCEGLHLAPGEHREGRDPGDHHSDLYRANRPRREE